MKLPVKDSGFLSKLLEIVKFVQKIDFLVAKEDINNVIELVRQETSIKYYYCYFGEHGDYYYMSLSV